MKETRLDIDHWYFDALDDGPAHADEGRDVLISLRHNPSGRWLSATAICYRTDNDSIVMALDCNDFALPTHTACRLLGRLCKRYVPEIGRFGESGLIARLDLEVVLRGLYPEGADSDFIYGWLTREKHDRIERI